MSRNHAVFVAALLGLSGLSSAVRAQACENDGDCVKGTWCEFEGGDDERPVSDPAIGAPACDGPDCPVDDTDPTPEPTPEPVKGTCQPLPKGLCVDESDCSAELECVIPSAADCTDVAVPEPATGGATALPKQKDCGEAVPASYGYCTLPETKCTTDAQCLTGLKCVAEESGSTPGDDGSSGSVEPTCAPGTECATDSSEQAGTKQVPESTCQVAFDSCDETKACATGYECIEEEVGCSSSGGQGTSSTGATTDPGETNAADAGVDKPAATKQRDPNCDYESRCYPKLTPCNSDVECTAGWVCFTFDGEDFEAPDYWNKTGMVKSCLPKGIALAAEASGGRSKGDFGADQGSGSATSAPESADDAAKSGSGGSSSCSVGSGQGAQGAAWLVGMLAMVARRRRQR